MAFTIVHDLLTGFANAPSGTASFYLPNTLTAIVIYGDDDGTATTNPVTLDSSGRANIWLTQLARMIVQTTGGVTVSDTVINAQADAATVNSSSAFTGSTQKDVNDAALTAFGGQNFQYVPGTGVGGMTPKSWMSGVLRNVLAYASTTAPNVNDGVTVADTAIAAATAAVVAAGGGVVYFPPGTYLVNAPITVTSGTGISFRGAGSVSIIKNNSGSGNAFTFTSCSSFFIENLTITSTSGSTGAAIASSAPSFMRVVGVTINSHQICVDVSGVAASQTTIQSCTITATNNAASRAVRYNVSGSSTFHRIYDTFLHGSVSGKSLEYNGTISDCAVIGSQFSQNCSVGILFNASLTGTKFVVLSSPSLLNVATPFDLSGLATDPIFRQFGNEVEGTTVSQAIPATFTPNRALGAEFHFRATSGGAATGTVAAPTPTPAMRGTRLTLRLGNGSGGAVTWSMNAVYRLVGGAAPSGTDGTTVIIEFEWDVQASVWRERFRAQTTT